MADDIKALIFDTETTGLFKYFNARHTTMDQLKPYPWVIEYFGHIVTDNGEAVLVEDFLVKPGSLNLIDGTIQKITGIKPEDVAEKPMFDAYADQVLAQLAEAEALVAHNLSYDLRIMEVAFKRIGRYDEFAAAIRGKRMICTVQESNHYKGHRLSLSLLHQHLFGEPFEGAHRASADVAALTRCYLKMRELGDI